jgi:hypothetical protein
MVAKLILFRMSSTDFFYRAPPDATAEKGTEHEQGERQRKIGFEILHVMYYHVYISPPPSSPSSACYLPPHPPGAIMVIRTGGNF